jgi:hypothetical protein
LGLRKVDSYAYGVRVELHGKVGVEHAVERNVDLSYAYGVRGE